MQRSDQRPHLGRFLSGSRSTTSLRSRLSSESWHSKRSVKGSSFLPGTIQSIVNYHSSMNTLNVAVDVNFHIGEENRNMIQYCMFATQRDLKIKRKINYQIKFNKKSYLYNCNRTLIFIKRFHFISCSSFLYNCTSRFLSIEILSLRGRERARFDKI